MSRFWSREISDLTPYIPGEQPLTTDIVKLNTNESPYGPSPRVIEAIREAAEQGLNLYPDPRSARLCNALAAYHDVSQDRVYVGNGSDEVLAHIFVALLRQDLPVLLPDITYAFYTVYCRFFGIANRKIPLSRELRIDLDDYGDGDNPVIIANPNAPTGHAIALNTISKWIERQPNRLVVIDEAYVDFGAETAIELTRRFNNLLIVRTMSKSRGLAGLRVGYAIGATDLIEALHRVKDSLNSYPLDRLAQAGGIASLEDESYFRQTLNDTITLRERMHEGLVDLGFDIIPSSANFLFARHNEIGGADLASALRTEKILVRHFNKNRIVDHVRISVGDAKQKDALLAALRNILQ